MNEADKELLKMLKWFYRNSKDLPYEMRENAEFVKELEEKFASMKQLKGDNFSFVDSWCMGFERGMLEVLAFIKDWRSFSDFDKDLEGFDFDKDLEWFVPLISDGQTPAFRVPRGDEQEFEAYDDED